MQNNENQQRIKTIYRMLLELASGNLAFRIPTNSPDVPFNELASQLNDIAEKMERLGYTYPYANTKSNIEQTGETAAIVVQKVQDYILNHLEEPLPTTKEIAAMFGTNEFTLKENFRRFLKTSIYQFYNEERLKKAHQLILQTNLTLKEIAFTSGFNDYISFYKAFKKRFDYAPSAMPRKLPEDSPASKNGENS